MLLWLKKHSVVIITALVTASMLIYIYGCEPKVKSLNAGNRMVTRAELQLELDRFIALAEVRMLDLDRQEKLRSMILENALVLVRGQPFNPVGLITAAAAVYGIGQAGGNVTRVVKTVRNKRKVNNGQA